MAKRKTETDMGIALDALHTRVSELADDACDLGKDLQSVSFPGDRVLLLDSQRAMLRAMRELSHLALCIASQVDRITQTRG